MKLTIKRAALLKILSLAYEAVPVKSTEPAFVNYLIDMKFLYIVRIFLMKI